jgi:hypothetical protein
MEPVPVRFSKALAVIFALLVLLSCADNVDRKFGSEASGYVVSLVGDFVPRQLVLAYPDGTSEDDALVAIAATGSTVLQHTPGTTRYLIETPLGKSLQEIIAQLSASPLSPACMPNFVMHSNCYGPYILMAHDESGQLRWLRDQGAGLESVALEYVVRVRGDCVGRDPGGIPVMNAGWVEILDDRVVEKHGTIALFDGGSGDAIVILVDDSAAAWEVLGPVTDEIASVPGIQGAGITLSGCELPPGLTSRAGGLQMRAAAYTLD